MCKYEPAFFDLQLRFARRMAELAGRPTPDTLLDYTNLYVRFALGRDFAADHPIWCEYVSRISNTQDPLATTVDFHRERATTFAPPSVVAEFGCFSYASLSPGRIRLHFRNADTEGGSSLSKARADLRRAELASLVRHARTCEPRDTEIVGVSWLYNLEAYRRLFPPEYLSTAEPTTNPYRHLPLWGQFLDRFGSVKDRLARPFLQRVRQLESVEGALACFPFQALKVRAPLDVFPR